MCVSGNARESHNMVVKGHILKVAVVCVPFNDITPTMTARRSVPNVSHRLV
jgi:hypothetical protein